MWCEQERRQGVEERKLDVLQVEWEKKRKKKQTTPGALHSFWVEKGCSGD